MTPLAGAIYVRPALLVVAVMLAAPAEASAHGMIFVDGGALSYWAEYTGEKSRLEVRATTTTVTVHDPGVAGGMQAPISCRPGRTNTSGQPVEFTCPTDGVERLVLRVGDDQDFVDITGPLRRHVDGGYGADTIRTGEAEAEVVAGEGNDDVLTGPASDVVTAGPGSDVLDTAAGDDRIESADGEPDQVRCGDGFDVVAADTVDSVAGDCEAVERRFVAPPPAPAEGDAVAPRLRVTAARSQRVSGGDAVVTASASESGSISASAYLAVAGLNLHVPRVALDVAADQAVRLRLRLSARQLRRVRRAVRRGRRPYLAVRVAATDRAGNSSPVRSLRIRVRA